MTNNANIIYVCIKKFPILIIKSAEQIEATKEINSKLESNCHSLKRNIQSLILELNETKSLSQNMQITVNQDMMALKNVFNEKISVQESHKNELLDEIRQMNAELMKRSSKLSAQEEQIQSIKDEGQNKLEMAQNEIQSLKDQLFNSSSVSTSSNLSKSTITVDEESMSTSTVSKVEETARMADVESSFEDRYVNY